MEERRVSRDDLDTERKRIAREGVERILSITPDGDDVYVIRLEPTGPRKETRA